MLEKLRETAASDNSMSVLQDEATFKLAEAESPKRRAARDEQNAEQQAELLGLSNQTSFRLKAGDMHNGHLEETV